jgi:quercetin dioxygenase-like cupin family protein
MVWWGGALGFAILLATPAMAAEPVTVETLFRGAATSAGQPITLPAGPVQVTVSEYEIAPGAVLPVHRHPFERYGYMQAGTLRVTNRDSGVATIYRAGDVIVEMINIWHSAENIGSDPVRILVIDQTPPGMGNTDIRP